MYDKNYKYQSLDAIEGYKVILAGGLPMLNWAAVAIGGIVIASLLVDFGDKDMELSKNFFSLGISYLCFFVLVLFISLLSYIKARKEYFFITKDGIDFCKASILRGETQRRMSWDEINYIKIFPNPIPFFTYNISIAEPQVSTPKYNFTLHWAVNPLQIVRILKDYSSGKIKIELTEHFSSAKWY